MAAQTELKGRPQPAIEFIVTAKMIYGNIT